MRHVLIALLLASPLAAQGPTAGPVTRRDLADAYLAIDGLVAARGLPDDRAAAVNRAFDVSTLAFFGGNYAKVLRDMHTLYAGVVGDTAPSSVTRRLLSLRVRAGSRVVLPGETVRAVLTQMYADSAWADPLGVTVELSRGGKVVSSKPVEIPGGVAGGYQASVEFPAPPLGARGAPSRLSVILRPARGATVARPEAFVFVLPRPADSLRVALLRRLDALAPLADSLRQAEASVRARAGLLVTEPAADNSAQFMADLAQLSMDVERELATLERGANPYAGRRGGAWRVVRSATATVPFRLYVPKAPRTPMPVVVALHGAGADENMFFDGYGAGILTTLAEQRGFVVISPVSSTIGRDVAVFDSLLAVVDREVPIDTSRIHVLGHSMGAGVATQLAVQRASRLKAVAMMAGGGAVTSAATPPLLFLGAEVDQVIPEPRVKQAFDRAVAAGAKAEYRRVDGYGHTLMVGRELPAVIDWLLATPRR